MSEKIVYVTGNGAVKLNGRLYAPGESVEISQFAGHERAFEELMRTGGLSKTLPELIRGPKGPALKFRKSDLPALKTEADLYDAHSKRELPPPVQGSSPSQPSVDVQLAKIRQEQDRLEFEKRTEIIDRSKQPAEASPAAEPLSIEDIFGDEESEELSEELEE